MRLDEMYQQIQDENTFFERELVHYDSSFELELNISDQRFK